MKKYFNVFKTEFINNLQYIPDILIGAISYILIIYIYFNLYSFIYSDSTSLINGYTYSQMVWYVVFTECFWSITKGRAIVRDISVDVKSGNIAYQLNKPYNYINYVISKYLSSSLFKLNIVFPAALVIGSILIGFIPNFNIIGVITAIITAIMGVLISMIICITLGLCAFFMEDSNPLYWVYSKVILIVGTLFPIEFMPKFLQPILNYSPIFAINYGPAKLFVEYDPMFLLRVVIIQIIYFIIFYIIAQLVYKKGVKNINVNGG